MSDMIASILDKMDEYAIDVYSHYESNETNYVFMVDRAIVILNQEKDEIKVSFHVSTAPTHAATFVLILQEISMITDLSVMEVFMQQEDQIIAGEEATKLYKEANKKEIIEKYVNDQAAMYMLATGEVAGSC